MKFDYEYRTKENKLCRGTISSTNRDSAYAELRKMGIKASRLKESPGIFNKILGKGKRWIAIGGLSVALGVTVLYHWRHGVGYSNYVIDAYEQKRVLPRHQIENMPTNWADYINDIFEEGFEREIAIYALPGVIVESMDDKRVSNSDSAWIEELKSVVRGMNEEAQAMIRMGKTAADVMMYFEERQKMEATYREQVLCRVKQGGMNKNEANIIFKAMGLCLIEKKTEAPLTNEKKFDNIRP